ncbi:MAG: protein kinase domain-containing protein, partial [Myxococcaceae bacterium]
MPCLDANLLSALREGKLSSAELAAAEEHLDVCSTCRQTVAEILRSSIATPGPATAPATMPKGASIGRYIVIEVLGIGGMGVVYAAYDPQLDRKVALKLLRPDVEPAGGAEESRLRLIREARAAARLSHPNVVAVHEVGTVDDQVYVAMEYVDGGTLTSWVAERLRPWREIVEVFVRAGRGLATAHAAGLVHRDFKLENVLIGKDGRVRVTDFGLARLEGESAPAVAVGVSPALFEPGLTRSGMVMGTPAYMAPEQLRGGKADARSDQFSFCVALYMALYGQRPFEGNTPAALEAASSSGK